MVQPGVWALVLLHVPSRDGFPVPIGYATRNEGVVAAIGRTIGETVTSLSETAVAWSVQHTHPKAALGDLDRVLAG